MKKFPNIILDIDEVLADTLTQVIIWHNKNYNTSLKPENFYNYKFWEIWGGTKDEAIVKVMEFFQSKYPENIMPVKGSQRGVENISKISNIHIVTSRRREFIPLTKSWLEKNFPKGFASVEFTAYYTHNNNTPIKKSDVCKKLDAKIIVEDDLEHALDCAKEGIKVLLLDKPWNRDVEHDNIIRVYSWDEIVENTEKLIKELYYSFSLMHVMQYILDLVEVPLYGIALLSDLSIP